MNTLLTATLAAAIAGTSLGLASAADAQSRGPARQQHQQQQARQDHRSDREQSRAPARWQRSRHHYNAGRYQPPRGQAVQQWRYGQRMPANYRSNAYVVSDYGRFGLRAPPRGHQYVRSGNDVVMVAVASGLVASVIASLFN